jgi:hypothetical protein
MSRLSGLCQPPTWGGLLDPRFKNFQPVAAADSAGGAESMKRPFPPQGILAPQDKHPWHNAPTAFMGQQANPQEGPILLSNKQVKELGAYIDRDVCLLEEQGQDRFIGGRCRRSDLSKKVDTLRHPAQSHLCHLRWRGARVAMTTSPWLTA